MPHFIAIGTCTVQLPNFVVESPPCLGFANVNVDNWNMDPDALIASNSPSSIRLPSPIALWKDGLRTQTDPSTLDQGMTNIIYNKCMFGKCSTVLLRIRIAPIHSPPSRLLTHLLHPSPPQTQTHLFLNPHTRLLPPQIQTRSLIPLPLTQ